MRKTTILLLLSVAVLLAAVAVGWQRIRPRSVLTDQFGPVRVFAPWLRERGFVYVLSGADGWSMGDQLTALGYAATDNYVVGIDTPQLLAYLNRHVNGCLFMPGLLEDYSRVQERTVGTPRDYEPLVFGRGAGASLVYLGQIGAPALALGAAVMLDPEPLLPLSPPICDHSGLSLAGGMQQLPPVPLGVNVPARVLLDEGASTASRAFVERVLGKPGAPAARSPWLRGVYAAALAEIEQEQQRSGVVDLPLIEALASSPRGHLFAILYSGDGGWRDLDRSLADVLAAKGISVVGVDVLRYYWRARAPDSAARDLTRIIQHYRQRWGDDQVVLIGFSFGADVLPFMVNRLAPAERGTIRLITLLSPERTTAFEVSPAGWMGKQADATIPVEPQIKGLSTLRVQCVYGEDEAKDSLCTLPAAAGFEIVRKPGGHHFDHDYDQLAESIIAAAGI